MNKFIAMGRLTKDVELKVTNKEKETIIAKFSIAVSRKFKKDGEPEADFFNCVTFGKTAKFVEEYFSKGQPILIEGQIRNSNYETTEGEKRNKTEIIVENVYFAGSSNKNNDESKKENKKVDDDVPFV